MEEKKQDPVWRVIKSMLRGAFVIALLLYLLYHLTNGFSAEMKTQIVKPVSEDVLVEGTGVILRDETVITSDVHGVISYLYADGERVGIRTKLATVYSGSADDSAVSRIAEIDRAIELLSLAEIDEDTGVSDGAAAEREISAMLIDASAAIGRGNYGATASLADRIMTAAIRRDTILLGTNGAGAHLSELKAERERLAASLGGSEATVRAPAAGYFYSYADGGEDILDYDSAKELTAAELRIKLGLLQAAPSNAVGKIVHSPKWYLLLPLDNESARPFKTGKSYDLLFEADGIRLSMKLEAKNEGADESLLTFTSIVMPQGFSFDRMQNVSVVSDTVSGYRIPSSALRVVDGYVGVYVRSGNNVKFRAVEQICESGSNVFVRTDTEGVTLYSGDGDETNDVYCKGLSLYDAVIVGGAKDLTPDRIVN